MMTLSEHIDEQDLKERVLRTGAIVAYGSKSRREGEDAVRAFKQGQQALQKGGTDVDVEDHLKRIEQSLYHLFDGLIAQRQQIGAGVAVDVVGHGLAAKTAKRR
tara:strand:- start:408 stop:719 length:312 start_codon:yes stop_codon:yes gene_type:complete